jgi:hypothetical protein
MATPQENELARQLFAPPPAQSMGALEAVKEAFLAVAPGLKDFIPEATAHLTHMGAQGTHELAAALFNGSGFVMYPRGGKDDPGQDGHGVHGPPQAQEHEQGQPGVQPEPPTQQQERGGRSM